MSHLPNPPDFPIEINITGFQNTLAHGFAQRFNIRGAGITVIDKKIAMQFGNLRVADAQAPHPAASISFQAFGPSGWPAGFLNVLPPVRDLTGWLAPRLSAISSICAVIVSASVGTPRKTAVV